MYFLNCHEFNDNCFKQISDYYYKFLNFIFLNPITIYNFFEKFLLMIVIFNYKVPELMNNFDFIY